jgi:transglutaminase-like putative cysteine protease
METRRVLVGCSFSYDAEVPTPVIFQVQPVSNGLVEIETDQWWSEPQIDIRGYADLYGNPCVRTVLPAGKSTFSFQAVAIVPDSPDERDPDAAEQLPDDLPDETLVYTLPSRYCLPDVLANEAWRRFGGLPRGYMRVQAICDYVHSHLTFEYGSTTARSSAVDVNVGRHGVCRDFTHLAISFCRAINIPARYVFGYLPDMDVPANPEPMDFAAWMEVWLGRSWWTFDPRNNVPRKGRVIIGRGRDASDVAMATTFGGPTLESMVVQAEELQR